MEPFSSRWLRWMRGGGGPLGFAARALAWPCSLAFALVAWARDLGYRRGWLGCRHPGGLVISVGNLTAGGTGKTPVVAGLAGALIARGASVCVLTRGYRARPGELGDEPRLLQAQLPGLRIEQDRDRLAGAERALAAGAEVLLLDDGFQHRRMARDLDVVCVSALDPWGLGQLLPRGVLREPLAGLARADVVVLSHADQVPQGRVAALADALAARAPGARLLCARHAPLALREGGVRREPAELAGARALAFSGLGSPAAFEGTLAELGVELLAHRRFADHHPYSQAELDGLLAAAEAAEARLLTTAKDAQRLLGLDGAERVGVVEVEVRLRELGPAGAGEPLGFDALLPD